MTAERNKIGIKDIARLANVSIGTVDRVLHNRPGVSRETRERVRKIMIENDYEPNLLASTLASHKSWRFGVLIPSHSQGNSYWKAPLLGIEKAEEEIRDFGITIEKWFFDLYSTENFGKVSTELIQANPDGIVFAPVFSRESQAFCGKLDQAGIPYVFIDAFVNGQKNLAFFGQDAFNSGYLAARLLDYGLPASAAILLVNLAGDSVNYNQLSRREKGFRAYFGDQGKLNKNIYGIEIPGIREVELNVVIKTELRKRSEIQGVFVTSNVQRVARVFDRLEGEKPKLVGYDLTEENLHYLQKGIIDFLIGQKPEQQGYDAIYLLFDHLVLNRKVKVMNYSPLDILTRENIQYYKQL